MCATLQKHQRFSHFKKKKILSIIKLQHCTQVSYFITIILPCKTVKISSKGTRMWVLYYVHSDIKCWISAAGLKPSQPSVYWGEPQSWLGSCIKQQIHCYSRDLHVLLYTEAREWLVCVWHLLDALWESQELLSGFGVLEVNSQHGARHCAAVHLLDTAHDHTHVPANTHTHTQGHALRKVFDL